MTDPPGFRPVDTGRYRPALSYPDAAARPPRWWRWWVARERVRSEPRPAMPVVQAMRMRLVGQDLDHTALRHAPVATGRSHAGQFGLQSLEASDAAPHRCEMRAVDGVRFAARPLRIIGEAEQLPDIHKRKPKLAGVPDEGEPVAMSGRIDP